MKCNKIKILLSASLDGELSPAEQIALDQHLESCDACTQEMEELSALHGNMVLWADEEPSPWLAQNFAYKLSHLKEETQAKSRRPRWIFGTAAAGFAAAVLFVGIFMHSRTQPPTQVAIIPPKPPVVATTTQPKMNNEVSKPKPSPKIQKKTLVVKADTKQIPTRHSRRFSSTRRHKSSVKRQYVNVAYYKPENPNRLGNSYGELGSRHKPASASEQQMVMRKLVAAGLTGGEATDAVHDNIGKAELAVNETMERVRMTLQKAVTVIANESAVYADDNIDSDKGETL